MADISAHIIRSCSAEKLATELAEKISLTLSKSLKQNGQASLVVSGGSTPVPLFEQLSMQPIDWPRVTITLADERWVDTAHESSNENLVRTHLLKNYAATAKFVGLKNDASTASKGEQETHARLNTVPRPFDLVILGMGNDGHTASLFPGASRLPEAVDLKTDQNCIGITPPHAPFERISMTLRTLIDAAEIILHITGNAKNDTLAKALQDGVPADMPIRYILRQQETPVNICWAP